MTGRRARRLAPMRAAAVVTAAALLAVACSDDAEPPPPSGATTTTSAPPAERSVRFDAPLDGETVPIHVDVALAAVGLVLEPAGEVRDGAGHLHVTIDEGCVEVGEVVPADDDHVHLAGGERSTQLTLAPGTRTLCAQLADGADRALEWHHEIRVHVDRGLPAVTLEVPRSPVTGGGPVAVSFAAANLDLGPPGQPGDGRAHLHLLVDVECAAPQTQLPADDQHLHFHEGETRARLDLAPGTHRLCLQAGDSADVALPVTHVVSVRVGG